MADLSVLLPHIKEFLQDENISEEDKESFLDELYAILDGGDEDSALEPEDVDLSPASSRRAGVGAAPSRARWSPA